MRPGAGDEVRLSDVPWDSSGSDSIQSAVHEIDRKEKRIAQPIRQAARPVNIKDTQISGGKRTSRHPSVTCKVDYLLTNCVVAFPKND